MQASQIFSSALSTVGRVDRAADGTVSTAGQAAVTMRLPIVGDGDDGSIVVNHTAATQPPSKKVHAFDRLTSGTNRDRTTQERCSELTGVRALQGSKKSVLRSHL